MDSEEGAPSEAPEASDAKVVQLRTGLIVAGAIAVVGAILFMGSRDDKPSARPIKVHHVVYEVEGTTTQASLTFATPNGGTSQQQDVDVPIKKKSDHTPGIEGDYLTGTFLYISAQNSKDSGSVTCRITVDGIPVAENTSSGAYTIATCSSSA